MEMKMVKETVWGECNECGVKVRHYLTAPSSVYMKIQKEQVEKFGTLCTACYDKAVGRIA